MSNTLPVVTSEREAVEVTNLNSSPEFRDYIPGDEFEDQEPSERIERINRCISIPDKITTNDGRELRVKGWQVGEVESGETIEITVRVLVAIDGKIQVA